MIPKSRMRVAWLACLCLAACAPSPEMPDEVAATRAELARLQADPTLAPLAAEALTEAETAVQLAEQGDAPELTAHRVYLAQRKIATARALAEARQAEQEREALVAQRERAQLDARTREAAEARMEADAARAAAAEARNRAVTLQQEIEAMNARQTDRGLVLTLGDVLFETGNAELKPGVVMDLDRLAAFLQRYPARTAVIEGHTDSVGGEDYNQGLSQRRADAVRAYLVRMGVAAGRVTATGMGESAPVASNGNATGRQQNRRVEIIVSDQADSAGSAPKLR